VPKLARFERRPNRCANTSTFLQNAKHLRESTPALFEELQALLNGHDLKTLVFEGQFFCEHFEVFDRRGVRQTMMRPRDLKHLAARIAPNDAPTHANDGRDQSRKRTGSAGDVEYVMIGTGLCSLNEVARPRSKKARHKILIICARH